MFLFPTLENLRLPTGQSSLDWPKHYPSLAGEITELIADGAAHEKVHVVLSSAFTVTNSPDFRPEGVECRRSHCWRAPLIIAIVESRGLPGRQQREHQRSGRPAGALPFKSNPLNGREMFLVVRAVVALVCCRSLGPLLCPLVGGPGAWCFCLVFLSSGPVLCSRPRILFLPFGFEKRLQPGEPSQRPVFRPVPLLQPGQLRFTWPGDLWFFTVPYHLPLLRLFRQMSFHSVLPVTLLSLRAKVVPAETGESELSIFFIHYASSSASLVVRTSLSRVTHQLCSTSGVHLRAPARNLHQNQSDF